MMSAPAFMAIAILLWLLIEPQTSLNLEKVKLFGHRGGIRGMAPDSSLVSFTIGAQMNADYLECDVVSSRDGQLMILHDITLDDSTDISAHPEFADRRFTFNHSCREPDMPSQIHNCYEITEGFFVFNFTLSELKTLRLRARSPYFGTDNPFNDRFEILTMSEFLYLVHNLSVTLNRSIGITPELKKAWVMRDIGLPMEQKYLSLLFEAGFIDYVNANDDHNFYQTKYFTKSSANLLVSYRYPLVIVQSDSYSALNIIGGLARNVYNASNITENVPLQFGLYDADTVDWTLIQWITTFANGINVPWTMVDDYYDLMQTAATDVDSVALNRVHFRLQDYIDGKADSYSRQYIRNQYFKAFRYAAASDLDAVFCDNVEMVHTVIDMLYEMNNSSSLLFDPAYAPLVQLPHTHESDIKDGAWNVNGWFYLFMISVVLWVITIGVVWKYSKRIGNRKFRLFSGVADVEIE